MTEDLLLKLFDKSPMLVICVLMYFGFVVPRKEKEKEAQTQTPAATIVQYDDSKLVRSIERIEERQESNRLEMKADLGKVKTEILEQVSRLDGIVTTHLLKPSVTD